MGHPKPPQPQPPIPSWPPPTIDVAVLVQQLLIRFDLGHDDESEVWPATDEHGEDAEWGRRGSEGEGGGEGSKEGEMNEALSYEARVGNNWAQQRWAGW